ncbi:hypothetical protein G6011_02337 [Alternaria panax]|uniref:YDG domain-containing protein n=1 Tax=Alternaria panax TaxID=48097 RepID=A0AAD4I9C7_9PLEO|nr:hypothetical protein G6011_02337 [Alternaria panax]
MKSLESQQIDKPSAWLQEKAQNAAKMSGVGPDTVARILQKTKAQTEANSEEHQDNMRVLDEKMTELRAKYDLNPFKDTGLPAASDTVAVQPKAIIPIQKGIKRKVTIQAGKPEGPRAKKAKFQKTQPSKEGVFQRAKEDAEKRAEIQRRQLENGDAEKQAKSQEAQQKKDDAHKRVVQNMQKRVEKVRDMRRQEEDLKDESISAAFAESSTAGPSRGRAATTTANQPDDMDVTPSNSLFVLEDNMDKHPLRARLPGWYTIISMKSPIMEAISKKRPPELTSLESLKVCVKQCEDAKSPVQLEKLYDVLRDHVHKAEIQLVVNRHLIRKANMLSPDYGLPQIFKKGADLPCDLKADAWQLYNRWWKSDLNQELLRGIVPNKTENRTSDRLDDTYRKKFFTDAKHYGNGDLVLGQWWPTQLCAVRDGAHGSAQGGIYGEKEHGAYSIVLSGGSGYQDVDNGDVIDYSGTPGKNSTPTENTVHLLKSSVLGNQVRVIRSAQLSKKNKYRPELGLRYDGLYQATSYTQTDQETAMYKFRLERCGGQDPIRFQGKAKRPTIYEIKEYEKLKDKGVW